jgi:hypothetical protein
LKYTIEPYEFCNIFFSCTISSVHNARHANFSIAYVDVVYSSLTMLGYITRT